MSPSIKSSFFKYCGLDTVQNVDDDGELLWLDADTKQKVLKRKYVFISLDSGEQVDGKAVATDDMTAEGEIIYRVDGENCYKEYLFKTIKGEDVPIYEDIKTEEEYTDDVVAYMHGRRKGDTEMKLYVDKDGNEGWKRSITYNPLLKTKLMGVLSGCLIKGAAHGEHKPDKYYYADCYYNEKNRLQNSEYHKNKKPIHINKIAERYMIKCFLRDMWTTWRKLEGLEVSEPYEVAKLGKRPHHDNRFQCEVAQSQKKAM